MTLKKYYAERNGLLEGRLQLTLAELLEHFRQTYNYFNNKGYFDVAFTGIYQEDRWTHERTQIVFPSMAPSPEVFFNIHLQSKQVWPVCEYIEYYDEVTLFSVIEILYDHIAKFNYDESKIETDKAKAEYTEMLNNLLRAYKTGYYLVPTTGFVMEQPNEALEKQLTYDGEGMPEGVYEQLKSASQSFYRFDADLESKKKAIASLADILEYVRAEVKDLFNSEYGVPKNEHDKLIFDIVNNYNIRHDNQRQKTSYSKDIWYEWMMQYYTSVIIAFYKLKSEVNLIF